MGRGGAGAPIKDSKGLAVTDLRTMHQFNQEGKIVSPRDPPPPVDTRFKLDLQEDYTDSSHQGDSAANSSPYARANTFREDQPQDMAKHQAQEEYKLFLKQQVEEKQRKKKEEDDMIREEELREEKRLEEQRLRMQREFEQEKEKQRLKEEETLKRNEEMKAASELKKKEAERRRKEMDEERQNELRKLAAQRNNNIDAQHVRTSSPVIPTLRAKEEPRSDSPPLPGQRKNQGEQPPVNLQEDIPQAAPQRYRSPPLQQNRPESLVSIRTEPDQDVLSQLTALKQQLKNEEMKIQSQMQNNKLASTRNRDPTSASRRAPRRDVDVFDRAVHNKVPARKSDGENYSPAEEFNKIKYGDATSLAGDFRNQYPEPASTGSVLDLQQQAYLREQEDRLASLRADLNEGRPGPSGTRQNGHYPPRPGSKTSLLDSDSKFLAVDNNQEIEAPSYDPPPVAPRQPSARERRRWKHLEDMARSDKPYGVGYKPPTPGGFSLNSVTSFNIDEVALKNEARLRKLEKLRGPGSTHDPDEVLKRFVTDHNRPESTMSGGVYWIQTLFIIHYDKLIVN